MLNSKNSETQTYSLTISNTEIEEVNVIVYGIKQTYITDDNHQIETSVENISDNKEIVDKLIEILSKEDVYYSSLQEIVEDYISEI